LVYLCLLDRWRWILRSVLNWIVQCKESSKFISGASRHSRLEEGIHSFTPLRRGLNLFKISPFDKPRCGEGEREERIHLGGSPARLMINKSLATRAVSKLHSCRNMILVLEAQDRDTDCSSQSTQRCKTANSTPNLPSGQCFGCGKKPRSVKIQAVYPVGSSDGGPAF
jgi:hypothetical protein